MIPRKVAQRLLDEYVDGVRQTSVVAPDTGDVDYGALRAIRDETLGTSDLVLRGAENAEQKARRYLVEGRIQVERVWENGLVVASARGTDSVYHLGYDPSKRQWRCTCPAPGRKCSHLIALRLVVAPREAANT